MDSIKLIIILIALILFMVCFYVKVVTKRHIKRVNPRCEEMLKDLEKEPYNTTIGEDLYGVKTKKDDKK